MSDHMPTIRRIATGCLALAAAATTAIPAMAAEDPDLDQEIDSDQHIATDSAVLSDGHVDIGPRYVDGEWTLLVHDDTADPPVWRGMQQTVFQVRDVALTEVPDTDAYAFLPAEPGTEVHVVPQAQQPDVVWVGWNTQDPEVMENIDRGATLRLRGVQGPGEMVMFLQSGDLSDPDVLWDSREPYPQDVWVQVNTHTHANWVFSEPGIYLVEVEVTADLISGETESDTEVLRFAVGDDASTDDALAAEYTATSDHDPGSEAEASEENDTGTDTGVLVAAGAAVLLIVAVVTVVVRSRVVKRRAETERVAAPGRHEGGAS